MISRLFALVQYALPQHALTRIMYSLTHCRWAAWKNLFIRVFIRIFGVDMSLAEQADARKYDDFNAFFTRALRDGVRPLPQDPLDVASPVDGTVSEAGAIKADRIYQAKGHDFTLRALLGGSAARAAQFEDGSFATIYLSPRDYHRIHLPFDAQLIETLFVPGRLFSVDGRTTRHVPGLFARNERVVTLFETGYGPMAVIMVGAMMVGSVETVWGGLEMPPHRKWRRYRNFRDQDIRFARGGEIARFNMGSTVILLFGKNAMDWTASLTANAAVTMGSVIGRWRDPSN